VKIGDGPAAVTLPFSCKEKGTLSAHRATVPFDRDGKAAARAGKSEDLPECAGKDPPQAEGTRWFGG
jgi:hypothetical protein